MPSPLPFGAAGSAAPFPEGSPGSICAWKRSVSDLLVDRAVELQEHDVALVAVLDERVLLGHAAQVDALAQVVHVLEVLAPADVDDLEHDEALEIAHQALVDRLDLRSRSS